jgi:hypothetical protein
LVAEKIPERGNFPEARQGERTFQQQGQIRTAVTGSLHHPQQARQRRSGVWRALRRGHQTWQQLFEPSQPSAIETACVVRVEQRRHRFRHHC